MQKQLEAEHPELNIQLLGMNEAGLERGNAGFTEGRDIPWLQDVDADADGQSDTWLNSWDAVLRDVVILDEDNVPVDTFNLDEHDLNEPENYETLKQMLVDTAMADEQPELAAGDANGDYRFDQLDLIQVLRARKYDTGQPATWEEGDWNHDGVFDRLDVTAALQTGNFLHGPYAATTSQRTDEGSLLAKPELRSSEPVAASVDVQVGEEMGRSFLEPH